MNRIKRIWILGLLLIGASCNSWLDVAPEDQIMEKDLFEEREGFLMALNGVYLNMNSSSNYGGNLSAGIIDVMAQYYNCTTSEHNYSGYQSYAYDSKTSKDRFETVWKTTYSQISNLNAILEHCGDGNPVLPELYYKLIKGEALGLRAMLHFDMLRLFGPLWTEKEQASIPYQTSSELPFPCLLLRWPCWKTSRPPYCLLHYLILTVKSFRLKPWLISYSGLLVWQHSS